MSNLGVMVMAGMLSGNKDSVNAFTKSVGKEIVGLELMVGPELLDEELLFTFADGSKMKLFDDGQSCCECRYMCTDDNLSDFIGATLLDAEIRDAPNEPDEYGEHEVQFMLVTTSKGTFTMASHNEHNGYYGGFLIRAAMVEA